jgi:hypothetical protein
MKWKSVIPTEPGEYVFAFRNRCNGLKGFKHIEINGDGMWRVPGTDEMIYMGNHLEIQATLKLTFPKSAASPVAATGGVK